MNFFCSAAIVTPVTLRPVVLGRVQGERAPAAADVEEPHARSEADLLADQVELVALRVSDAVRRVLGAPVARGVGHRGVEDQRVELVGEVVVVADRPAVAQLAVQPAAHPRLGLGQPWRLAHRADVDGGPQRSHERSGGRAYAGEAALRRDGPDVGQRLVEVVVHLELAGDVGLRGTELTRVPQQPAYGVPRTQLHERSIDGACLGAVPRAQPDRQVAADERAQRRLEPVGDARLLSPARPTRRCSVVVIRPPGRGSAAARRCSPRRNRRASSRGRSATSARRLRRSRGL